MALRGVLKTEGEGGSTGGACRAGQAQGRPHPGLNPFCLLMEERALLGALLKGQRKQGAEGPAPLLPLRGRVGHQGAAVPPHLLSTGRVAADEEEDQSRGPGP